MAASAVSLQEFSTNYFPGAIEYKSDFHSTLLYIGGGYSKPELSEPFLNAGVSGYFFRSTGYVLMVGGDNDDLILLAYRCPAQCILFDALDRLYRDYGIEPEHKRRYDGPGMLGFTPHVTLAKFRDSRTAKASLQFGLEAGAVKALTEKSPSLSLFDFHLYGDYDKSGKFVIV